MFIYHNVLVPSVPIHYGKKNIGESCKGDTYEHIQYIKIQKYRYAKYIDMYNLFSYKNVHGSIKCDRNDH